MAQALRGTFRKARSLLIEETERGSLFVASALLFASGAFLYFAMRAPLEHWQLIAIGTPALAIAFVRRGRMSGAIFLLLFAMLAGAATAAMHVAFRNHQTLGSPVATVLTGRILNSERLGDGRRRLVLSVVETTRPELRYAPDKVRVTIRGGSSEAQAGEVVRLRARLLPPSGPVRPGGYDFSFNAWFDGLGAIGFALGKMERVKIAPSPDMAEQVKARVNRLRETIDRRIAMVLNGPSAAIASALIAGYGAAIGDDEREALRVSGLAHVLSISGLHMALAAGTVIGAIRLALALFPTMAARYSIRKWAAAGGLLAAGGYLVLSGAAIATQRSFIMLAIMLAALLCDRTAITMRNLALAMVLVVLIAPHEVIGPSFQMSFAATAALIAAYRSHSLWQRRRHLARESRAGAGLLNLPVRFGAGILATTLIAGAATTIFALWHFQRVAPLAPLGNLLAAPVISILVMPMAVLSLLLMPFGLEAPFLKLMGEGIEAMLWIARFVSEISPPDRAGLVAGQGVMLLTIALALFAVLQTALRWTALPFAIIGLGLLGTGERPAGFILDNGRAVALAGAEGTMISNRARLSNFVGDQWMAALGAERLIGPQKVVEPSGAPMIARSDERFFCSERLCLYDPPDSLPIIWLKYAEDRASWCGRAAIIVIGDTTQPKAGRCSTRSPTLTIDRMDLAKHGSAALWRKEGGGWSVSYSFKDMSMPWHDARRWSRPARGLPDWTPRKRDTSGDKDKP
ncbi:ComEC/Rec2 family competence protein [Notoacmeibacter ruber]|nr:ComEC/Rec2 family competence protein [Notoacmeibacter ruber]